MVYMIFFNKAEQVELRFEALLIYNITNFCFAFEYQC
jgi:hypothetical protein